MSKRRKSLVGGLEQESDVDSDVEDRGVPSEFSYDADVDHDFWPSPQSRPAKHESDEYLQGAITKRPRNNYDARLSRGDSLTYPQLAEMPTTTSTFAGDVDFAPSATAMRPPIFGEYRAHRTDPAETATSVVPTFSQPPADRSHSFRREMRALTKARMEYEAREAALLARIRDLEEADKLKSTEIAQLQKYIPQVEPLSSSSGDERLTANTSGRSAKFVGQKTIKKFTPSAAVFPVAHGLIPHEVYRPDKVADSGGGQGDHSIAFSLIKEAIYNTLETLNPEQARVALKEFILSLSSAPDFRRAAEAEIDKISATHEKVFEQREARKRITATMHGMVDRKDERFSAADVDLVRSGLKTSESLQLGEMVRRLEEMAIVEASKMRRASRPREANPHKDFHKRDENSALYNLRMASFIINSAYDDTINSPDFMYNLRELARISRASSSDEVVLKNADTFCQEMGLPDLNTLKTDEEKIWDALNEYCYFVASNLNTLFDFKNSAAIAPVLDADRLEDIEHLPALTARLLNMSFRAFNVPEELKPEIADKLIDHILNSGDKDHCWGEFVVDAATKQTLTPAMLKEEVMTNYLNPNFTTKESPATQTTFRDMVAKQKADRSASAAASLV